MELMAKLHINLRYQARSKSIKLGWNNMLSPFFSKERPWPYLEPRTRVKRRCEKHYFQSSFEVGAKIFQFSGQLFSSVDLWIFLHCPTHFLGPRLKSYSMPSRLFSAPGA